MSNFFITKQQKRAIKDRRKKKRLYEQGLVPPSTDSAANKKRLRSDDDDDGTDDDFHHDSNPTHHEKRSLSEEVLSTSVSKTHFSLSSSVVTITVPANLSGKDLKKFRKDARRKVRTEHGDHADVKFILEGQEEKPNKPPPSKKIKRTYPCIKDLVRQQEEQKIQSTQVEMESALDDSYKSQYVALDCEMVGIGSSGRQSALARVSLVNWDGDVLVDTHVQVPMKVTDYRTAVSGILPKHIARTKAMDPVECREKVAALLQDKILVGHSLSNDLDALLLQHPKGRVRDTAKYRPFQRLTGGNKPKWRPRKLRDLVLEHCNLTIQQAGQSHDSVDDARATMALFRTVHDAWEKELQLQTTAHK
jgi:RNA exonuclease 4